MFLASRFGLVALIANGYRALAYLFLASFVLPLLTVGVWRLCAPAATQSRFKLRSKPMRNLRRRIRPASLLAALDTQAAPPAGFEQRVEAAAPGYGVPGMTIAIVENGQPTLADGCGVRKLGTRRARRCRHDLRHRLDRQGVHRRGARGARRPGQDQVGRQGHRPHAGLPHVGPVGHARNDGPRPARPSQRPWASARAT